LSDALGISLNVLMSLLVRYFIYGVFGGELNVEKLLKNHLKLQRDKRSRKTCKMTLRIKESEFRKLDNLANQWFYLPGELTGILVELFTIGVINLNNIWNIQLPRETTAEQNIPA
jgi:hypothetical protein